MARASTGAARQRARRAGHGRAARGGRRLWLAGIALVALATPTALLATLLFAPALVVFTVERAMSRGQGGQLGGLSRARAVVLFGVSVSSARFWELWTGANSIPAAMTIASDAGVLGLAWASQGAGWLAGEMAPLLAQLALETAAAARATSLRAQRTQLCGEWWTSEPDDG